MAIWAAARRDWVEARDVDEEAPEWSLDNVHDGVTQALTTIAHLHKSPGFKGEQEVRLVARLRLRGTNHVQFRPGAYGATAYVTMASATGGNTSVQFLTSESPPLSPLPITSVRLGPLLDPDNKTTVQTLLRQSGLREADVTVSQVPLR